MKILQKILFLCFLLLLGCGPADKELVRVKPKKSDLIGIWTWENLKNFSLILNRNGTFVADNFPLHRGLKKMDYKSGKGNWNIKRVAATWKLELNFIIDKRTEHSYNLSIRKIENSIYLSQPMKYFDGPHMIFTKKQRKK